MKSFPESDDELLKSLVEETKALPQAAAAQARARQRTRMSTIRITTLLAVSALTGIWFSQRPPHSKVTTETPHAVNAPEASEPSTRQGYVKIHQVGEAVAPDPIPPDATEREKELLTELPDVPLLIVKNEAGQVARVHIFER
jgi:hypothetical protein